LAQQAPSSRFGSPGRPFHSRFHLTGASRTFALGLGAAVTMATGLAPAWPSCDAQSLPGLRYDGRTAGPAHARLRSALVVVQVALSVGLLFMGALFTRSLGALNRAIPPIAREILVMELELKQAGGYTRAEARRFADAVTSRLAMNSRISARDSPISCCLAAASPLRQARPASAIRPTVVSSRPGGSTPSARVLAGRLLNPAMRTRRSRW
jgi:hypothetical protein